MDLLIEMPPVTIQAVMSIDQCRGWKSSGKLFQ